MKQNERQDLNCAVKEYLLLAGYRLTAMTFYEEVTDQNLDSWPNSHACVPDALRHYYYQYLSSTEEAAEEKIGMLKEKESLLMENEKLNHERESLLRNKEVADGQITTLTRSIESLQKHLKEKDILVPKIKQLSESQRKELNDCRAEITLLKMHIEGSRSGKRWPDGHADQAHSSESSLEETKSLLMDTDKVYGILTESTLSISHENGVVSDHTNADILSAELPILDRSPLFKADNTNVAPASEKMELLPLIMCTIERHPDSNARDSLTHTLFNLIKRPDELQRRIIMDTCVNVATNVGEMRTDMELLPQCWEQINHMYEERRLLNHVENLQSLFGQRSVIL